MAALLRNLSGSVKRLGARGRRGREPPEAQPQPVGSPDEIHSPRYAGAPAKLESMFRRGAWLGFEEETDSEGENSTFCCSGARRAGPPLPPPARHSEHFATGARLAGPQLPPIPSWTSAGTMNTAGRPTSPSAIAWASPPQVGQPWGSFPARDGAPRGGPPPPVPARAPQGPNGTASASARPLPQVPSRQSSGQAPLTPRPTASASGAWSPSCRPSSTMSPSRASTCPTTASRTRRCTVSVSGVPTAPRRAPAAPPPRRPAPQRRESHPPLLRRAARAPPWSCGSWGRVGESTVLSTLAGDLLGRSQVIQSLDLSGNPFRSPQSPKALAALVPPTTRNLRTIRLRDCKASRALSLRFSQCSHAGRYSKAFGHFSRCLA